MVDMRRRNRAEEDPRDGAGETRADDRRAWAQRPPERSGRPLGHQFALSVAWASLVLCLVAFGAALLDIPANTCAMTYMWPSYVSVPVPHEEWNTRTSYSLYLYRERGQNRRATGVPVLFIPGNAGSGKQVRSLGSQAHADLEVSSGVPRAAELDFWAVDFEEELSALSGGDLRAQAQFACRTIPFILSQYPTPRDGVVLVGHSMGGIVARLVAGPFCDAHQDPPRREGARVLAVLTIATPHTGLPAVVDPLLRNMFSASAGFWRAAFHPSRAGSGASELVLMSLGGGERDVLVGTERTDVYQLCPPTHCLSASTTALAGAWLSVDHRASLWCNQVVSVLTNAIQSLATEHAERGFEWKAGKAAKMEALQRAVLPGPRMLEALSHAAPHVNTTLAPGDSVAGAAASRASSGRPAWDVGSWAVKWLSGNSSIVGSRGKSQGNEKGTEAHLTIRDVEEETVYLWRVPAVASVDGVGGGLVLTSSLALRSGAWRIILCGKDVDTLALHASAADVAHACLEGDPTLTRQDITSRAVKLQDGGCNARWNADCVPSEPTLGGVRWLISVAAHELRPLQVICIVGPQRGSGNEGWMAGMRLVPPSSSDEQQLPLSALFDWSDRRVDEKGLGAWYLPMPTLPGSIYPLPATMVLEHTASDLCHAPLFKPMVLQTAEMPWHDGVGEGWARAEVEDGERVQVWHQQRRAPWLSHGAPSAVILLTDPRCLYRVRVRGHAFWALALSMRRHIVRLLPLTGAALCLRRIYVRFYSWHEQGQQQLVDLCSLMVALWVLVLLHPVMVCLFWASCSKCSSFWGCTVGGGLVSDMISQADSEWGWPAAWKMGDRDSVNWSHVEHPLVSGLLVSAATALSLLLVGGTAAISRVGRWFVVGDRSGGTSRKCGGYVETLRLLLVAVLAILHPALASLIAMIYTVPFPLETAPVTSRKGAVDRSVDRDKSSTRSPPQADQGVASSASHLMEGHTLGALSLLCLVVRLPSFVALVRCLAVSAKGHEGRLSVLYQDRFGPSLESLTGGSLGAGVGCAHTLDVLAGVLLACAARIYWLKRCRAQGRHDVAEGAPHAGARSRMVLHGLFSAACAFTILFVQEDIYVVLWILAGLVASEAFA